MLCFFSSDLHGRRPRYLNLLSRIRAEKPGAVFLGGDLLPMPMDGSWVENPNERDFLTDFMIPAFSRLAADLGGDYPRIFIILGNDDARVHEQDIEAAAANGIWEHVHGRHVDYEGHAVYGYACIPPSPFNLKDWERYDVSMHVDPGCVSPENGVRTVPVKSNEIRFGTIQKDLAKLVKNADLSNAIFLFHSPPYKSNLDRADLDGRMIDHVPLDVNIGSIAISRFIDEKQPLATLHGHVHESTRLTGEWRDRIGRTHCFQAAHDGPELSILRFDPADLDSAERELLPA